LVVMVFAHVFTTVYDYIPVVGAAFRDRYWLVHVVAGLGLALPLATLRSPAPAHDAVRRPALSAALVAVALLTSIAAILPDRTFPPQDTDPRTLTVFTYNIQQGYSEDGQRSAAEQLALIRQHAPDIVGLQESDTNRIAGGNADLVQYFADELGMYSTYGPTPVVGTFGIALLSRYPIEDPRTFFMYSKGEQTATIEAQIVADGTRYSVYVTHLGNGGPIVQQEAILEIAAGEENVVLMGDFNFRPDSDQYELTAAALDDAWLRRWPDGVDDTGADPARRIDHVFISPSLSVVDIRYLDDPASDHPAVVAELAPPE